MQDGKWITVCDGASPEVLIVSACSAVIFVFLFRNDMFQIVLKIWRVAFTNNTSKLYFSI